MNREDKFNQIFDECLDRLFKGESIDHILAEYPGQAKELEPLLRTAAATRAFSKIQPRADFKARARYEFMSAARDLQMQPKKRSFFKWGWQSGLAMSLTAFLAVVMIGTGTVAASNYSMPGQTLYSVKLASEQVRLAFTFSDVSKTELNAEYANRRTEEIEYLASAGNVEQIQKAASRLNVSLSNMSALAQDENLLSITANDTNRASEAFSFSAVSVPADNGTQALMAVPATNNKGIQPPVAETPTAGQYNTDIVTPSPSEVTGPRMAPAPQITAVASVDNAAGNNLTVGSAANGSGAANNVNILSKRDKIRKIIEDNYQTRQARLESALEKASPELKPAILQAIADSESEYLKSLQNLDQGAYNMNQNYMPENNQNSVPANNPSQKQD